MQVESVPALRSAPPFTKTPYNIFTRAAAFCGRFCVARRYTMPVPRPDRNGSHQTQFRINKKKIYATQTVCGICGKPVDFSLKYPHPLSACIDHIIPIAKGGHPSALENLQLAHWCCNRQKSVRKLNTGHQHRGNAIQALDLVPREDRQTHTHSQNGKASCNFAQCLFFLLQVCGFTEKEHSRPK